MPFMVDPHLKVMSGDPEHVRASLLQEEAELKARIADVRKKLAVVEGKKPANGTGDASGPAAAPAAPAAAVDVASLEKQLSATGFLGGAAWGDKDKEQYDVLKGNKQFREVVKKGLPEKLKAWWDYGGKLIREQAIAAKGGAAAVAKAKPQGGGKQKEAEGDKLVLQQAVEGKVVTRFPPEASGFMHIGHAKAALTNWMLAQKYKGKMVFRFDDTNPVKEKHEFEEAIVEDTKRLGIGIDKVTYTSDRFEEMFDLCDKMIAQGKFYCDDTPVDQMRDERMKKVNSKHREASIEANQKAWAEMKKGSATGQTFVVRAKIDMQADNACLRDPVMYRVNLQPHVRTGDKYKAYPTYDFACPVVDALDGVTHALRTSEYNDRNDQYHWVLKALDIAHRPMIEDFSRLNMEFTVMSKRKLTNFVDRGLVESWDDPRMPTVKGLLRRGLTVDALRAFITHQGMSKTNNFQEWGWMWNANCRSVDSQAARYVAVAKDYSVKVTVKGQEGTAKEMRQRHNKNPELGERHYYKSNNLLLEDVDCKLLTDGEEVTFMAWGNAYVRNYDVAKGTAEAELHLEGDFKKTKSKLTWLADTPENKVLLELQEFDHLITTKRPPKKERAATADTGDDVDEDDDDVVDDGPDPLEAVMNKETKDTMFAWGEEAIKEVKLGQIIQLERRGFFIVDKLEPHIVLISMPDGHEKANPLSMRARKKKDAPAPAEKKEEKKKEDKKKGGDKQKGQKDEREMTLEERRAAKKAQKESKPQPKAAAAELTAAAFNIKIGKILEIGPHPDADSLFVEQIDLGEGAPRTIVSGLRKFYQAEELQGKMVAVLSNMKPAAMRGVSSSGMVLCASTGDKDQVKVLDIPAGAKPGERVTFPGLEGEPVEELPKKKLPGLLEKLHTDGDGKAMWGDYYFTLESGACTSTLKNATVS